MATLLNVNDVDSALSLANGLAKDRDEYEAFVHAVRSVANDAQALDKTQGMNKTIYDLFTQIADALEPMLEPYDQAVNNLKNVAENADHMREAQESAALGQVGLE